MYCPICFSEKTKSIFKNTAIDIERDVMFCEGCNLFFVFPLPTADELDSLYKKEWSWEYGLDEKSSIIRKIFHFIHEAHQKFIARERANYLYKLAPNQMTNILEVGSGSGAFLREIAKYYKFVRGIEPSLDEEYISEKIQVKRETIDDSLVIDDQYDVICMYMVLEHLANPVKTLNTLKNGLKKGGHLVIEVPYSPYKEYESLDEFELCKVFENVHLFHFSRKNVEYLKKKLAMTLDDFKVIQKIEFIEGYNVFAIYPNSSRRGLGYKFISLINLLSLYARGLVRLSIHKPVDEFQTKFGDGFWIRFVLKK